MSDEIYYVERILDRKIEEGKPRYLIKWQGYTSEDNTWEPPESLDPLLIKLFEDEYFSKVQSTSGDDQNASSASEMSRKLKAPPLKKLKKSSHYRHLVSPSPSSSAETLVMPSSDIDQVSTVSNVAATANKEKLKRKKMKKDGEKEKEKKIEKKNKETERNSHSNDKSDKHKPKPLLFKSDTEKQTQDNSTATAEACEYKDKKIAEIKGFITYNEALHLMVKFVGCNYAVAIPNKTMRDLFPQELIDFYENSIVWNEDAS